MKKFGHDLLKDDTFYEDLPELATKRISQVFKDNTYLFETGAKIQRLMGNYDLEQDSLTKVGDEKHAKILLGIKKQLGVM